MESQKTRVVSPLPNESHQVALSSASFPFLFDLSILLLSPTFTPDRHLFQIIQVQVPETQLKSAHTKRIFWLILLGT